MIDADEEQNHAIFRECLSELVTSRLAPTKERRRVKGRKNEIKPVAKVEPEGEAVEELGEFIDYLATEIFTSLPNELQRLSYNDIQNDQVLKEKYSTPLDSEVYDAIFVTLPPTVSESFDVYALLPTTMDLSRLLEPVFTAYVTAVTTAPPEHDISVRATECEICDRSQLPLTYHHLIPKQMHAKAVKRGWAKEWELAKVAWLCRACHSFVHRITGNEELAKELNSVEKLMEREEVRSWGKWVGRIRWKKT
ncbi:hypothetical protein B9Z65_7736 [Elsinoe australis]|uniref:Uncharacterized protein n=1 Tax=Elsinoe australis TaxID=40998 RepID=A0A2P8A0E5_9PEZI|nr:hypothetical protein B9Z65_7736 [Elsinoe australis]